MAKITVLPGIVQQFDIPDAVNVEQLQETIDNLTLMVNFINTNVVSALNNNVQRAQEVASQANDNIVGLTTQLQALQARVDALENQ